MSERLNRDVGATLDWNSAFRVDVRYASSHYKEKQTVCTIWVLGELSHPELLNIVNEFDQTFLGNG
jgi:hypothetical protein